MPLDAEGYKGVFAFLWEDSQVPIFQEAANICMTVLHPTSSKDGRMKRYAVAIDGVQCGSRRVGPSLKRRFSVFGLAKNPLIPLPSDRCQIGVKHLAVR